MNKIKLFIADDHALFRQGVKNAFQSTPEIEITGEAESFEQLLSSQKLANTDVLLLDVSLGERSGLEAIQPLIKKYSDLKFLILSMHNKPVLLKRAVNLGISGYLLKQSPPDRLIESVKAVYSGKKYLDPELSESIFTLLGSPESTENTESLYGTLSTREQQIFRMLAEGKTAQHISKILCISRKTVENHRSKIISKLQLDSPSDIIQLAEKLGVI